MLRTKMMLLTVLVAALAVPSIWAQKQKNPERLPSVKQIQQSLKSEAAAKGVAAVCAAVPIGMPPAGYYAGTNKCSSSNSNYGFGNSLNVTVGTCSDKGGVEGNYLLGMQTDSVGTSSALGFTAWQNTFEFGSTENPNPPIYSPVTTLPFDVTLTLKRNEAVFGLEVDNTAPQTYSATFHTTAGDVNAGNFLVGGLAEPNPMAQRFSAICSAAAITGVTIHCVDCSDLSGPTAIAQIRGDKFPGF